MCEQFSHKPHFERIVQSQYTNHTIMITQMFECVNHFLENLFNL